MRHLDRVTGTVLGSAVGDALGAPFEFGLPGVYRARFPVLAPGWHPDDATEFNGAVWPCLGSALWALRTTGSFEEALAAAIDLGGDTDTVAAVTGALAGAVYGADAIPPRWTSPLHVPLPGHGDRVLRAPELATLAERLSTKNQGPAGSFRPGPSP